LSWRAGSQRAAGDVLTWAMAVRPMASAARDAAPALKRVRNERRSVESGDGFLIRT